MGGVRTVARVGVRVAGRAGAACRGRGVDAAGQRVEALFEASQALADPAEGLVELVEGVVVLEGALFEALQARLVGRSRLCGLGRARGFGTARRAIVGAGGLGFGHDARAPGRYAAAMRVIGELRRRGAWALGVGRGPCACAGAALLAAVSTTHAHAARAGEPASPIMAAPGLALTLTSGTVAAAYAEPGEAAPATGAASTPATAPAPEGRLAPTQPIELDTAAALAGDPAKGYGRSDGRWWLTLGGGTAWDFDEDYDFNLHVAGSTFIADELEFAVELGGWYFLQEGPDTGGVNGSFLFRWHFWHDEAFDWTVYGDVGIGLLGAFDDTPVGGTSFNFTPRAGAGFTKLLDEAGTRLQVGVRWHHISNGRIEGDGRNPSRDSIMLYAGVVFPF